MRFTRRVALGAALAPFLRVATPKNPPTPVSLPRGLWPVMLTPFQTDKSIDWKALDALTDWYLANGTNGLFACCASSEVYFLTEDERIEVASRVVKRAGKVPVVASGIPGNTPATVVPFIKRLMDTGVQAAVFIVNQLADKQESDATWTDRAETLLVATGRTPLGLYEAPRPYKRLLTPETMGWAAKSGRFVFEKDTSCDINAIQAKLKVTQGTPLRLFNAHSPILIDAVRKGGDGFCGIAANAYPNLCAWMLQHYADQPSQAETVQDFVRTNEKLLSYKYPASAKILAHLAGVPLEPVCRSKDLQFTADEISRLKNLRHAADTMLSS